MIFVIHEYQVKFYELPDIWKQIWSNLGEQIDTLHNIYVMV